MRNYLNWDLILIILFLIWIIRGFSKKPKTYKDYIKKSINYATILSKKKSIQILKDGLISGKSNKYEIYGLNISISRRYYSFKDYDNALEYFEEAMELIKDEKFCFDNYYLTIIHCYIKKGNIERAKEIYNDLLARVSYDQKFEKVKTCSHFLIDRGGI